MGITRNGPATAEVTVIRWIRSVLAHLKAEAERRAATG